MLDIDPTKILVKERLHPGKMLLVDTVKGEVVDDEALKERLRFQHSPTASGWTSNLVQLKDLKIPNERVPEYYGG